MTYFHSLSLSEVCDRYEPLVVILLVYTRSFWIIVLFPLIDIDRWTISKGYTTRTATLSSNDHDFFNGTWFLPDDISYTIPAREPERFFFFFFFRVTIRSHDIYICMRLTNFQGFDFN